MEKAHIIKEDKVKYVMMERKILHGVTHPFIIKMYFSFQDTRYLYMCMDLAPGGELLQLILNEKEKNEARGIYDVACDRTITIFYIAEIIEALCYLHSKKIIHRDLKPENIIISDNGHIKLADFGTAFNGDDEESSTLEKFVGTAEYVTPELLNCGSDEDTILHNVETFIDNDEDERDDIPVTKACDLWALGCIVYQMLVGKTPFRATTEYLIFENIKNYAKGLNPIIYHSCLEGSPKSLIESLLTRIPGERLGAGDDDGPYGYNNLKSHEFFTEIKWDELENTKSPHIPDPSNFPKSIGMYDGASDEWEIEGEATPITTGGRKNSDEIPVIAETSSDKPNENKWSKFLNKGEIQIFTGLVWKRRGIFSKKRQLILTSTPRLIYVDPDTMELKGEIPWTEEKTVKCTVITNISFDIFCSVSGRSYHITDSGDAGAAMWVDLINAMVIKQKNKEKLTSED